MATRALVPFAAWVSVRINIVINANIRAVKVWGDPGHRGCDQLLAHVARARAEAHGRRVRVPLLYYKSHELPATAFVVSGLLAHSVCRKRDVFFKRPNKSVIEYVSLYVNLHFQVYELTSRRAISAAFPPSDPTRPEYEKKFKYARCIGVINVRCTVLQLLSRVYNGSHWRHLDVDAAHDYGWLSFSRVPQASVLLPWFGVLAIATFIASVFVDVYCFPVSRIPLCQLGALTLTLLYCGVCAQHYQRQLLRELCATFDVLFLATQLLVVHAGVCDIFQFSKGCVVVLIAWLWCLWLLLLDAISPVVKTRLDVSKSFVVAVVVVLIASSVCLVYLLVFAASSETDVRDRVLWNGHVFGQDVAFRFVPIFYNSSTTAFTFVLRLLWRVLVLLDGAVVYENYLRKARDRNSRRWGSIQRTRERGNPRVEQCVAS